MESSDVLGNGLVVAAQICAIEGKDAFDRGSRSGRDASRSAQTVAGDGASIGKSGFFVAGEANGDAAIVFGDGCVGAATQLEGSGGGDLALAVSIQAQIKVERAGLAQLGAKGAHNVGGLLLDATDIADGPGHAARAQQRDRGHGDDKQTNGKANHELNQCQAGLEFQVFLLFIPCWISA